MLFRCYYKTRIITFEENRMRFESDRVIKKRKNMQTHKVKKKVLSFFFHTITFKSTDMLYLSIIEHNEFRYYLLF